MIPPVHIRNSYHDRDDEREGCPSPPNVSRNDVDTTDVGLSPTWIAVLGVASIILICFAVWWSNR